MSNHIIKHMWTEEELWDGSHSIFHLLFFLFSQICNFSIYHLLLPSCALASYHPLLTLYKIIRPYFWQKMQKNTKIIDTCKLIQKPSQKH